MYINSPDINQTDDDDLFTRPPRSSRRMPVVSMDRLSEQTARRACRVCDTSYVGALDDDGPPLCDGCRADIPAARERVQHWIDGIDDQEAVAWREWSALAEQHVDHWARIVAARTTDPDFATKAQQHRAKGNIYGKLLDAEEAYDRAVQALQAERRRLERAMEGL